MSKNVRNNEIIGERMGAIVFELAFVWNVFMACEAQVENVQQNNRTLFE